MLRGVATLPEAGVKVGEVPVAVFWDGDLGPLASASTVVRRKAWTPFAAGADACLFMRAGWAPPFGVLFTASEARLLFAKQQKSYYEMHV